VKYGPADLAPLVLGAWGGIRSARGPGGAFAGPRGGVDQVNKGKAGVERSLTGLRAGGATNMGTEITFKPSGMKPIRIDIVEMSPGSPVGHEVKNGPSATYTPNQRAVGMGPGVTSVTVTGQFRGANAERLGLDPTRTYTITIHIEHW
jgi:hypothetical protein